MASTVLWAFPALVGTLRENEKTRGCGTMKAMLLLTTWHEIVDIVDTEYIDHTMTVVLF